jgi:hypothetical protein
MGEEYFYISYYDNWIDNVSLYAFRNKRKGFEVS